MQPDRELSRMDAAEEIVALFTRERNDGIEKMADGYWGNGSRNVGRAVRTAVRVSMETIRKLGNAPMPLSEWLEVMQLAQKRHFQEHDNEDYDGFGIGTIGEIQNELAKIAEKYGAAVSVSPSVLIGI
jgi:hypothetical protein